MTCVMPFIDAFILYISIASPIAAMVVYIKTKALVKLVRTHMHLAKFGRGRGGGMDLVARLENDTIE